MGAGLGRWCRCKYGGCCQVLFVLLSAVFCVFLIN